MFVDIADLDEDGSLGVAQAAKLLQKALDTEAVTKKFFKDFETEHTQFLTLIQGIGDDRDRRWYASVLLNRLMFIYFLQRKFFSTAAMKPICRTSSRCMQPPMKAATMPSS